MNGNNDRSLRILAVDDEQMMLDLYKNALSLLGDKYKSEYDFEVILCKQGDEALEAVREAEALDEPFAVAFLDLKLPMESIFTGRPPFARDRIFVTRMN